MASAKTLRNRRNRQRRAGRLVSNNAQPARRGTSRALVRVSNPMLPAVTNFQEAETRRSAMPMVRFRTNRRGRPRNSNTPLMPPLVEAMVDPWSQCAPGLKLPDNYRGLSGSFSTNYEAQITTSGALASQTDLNQVGCTPTLGTSLFLITPDPSNMLVQGIIGTQAAGIYSGLANQFAWPNGILFTAGAGTLNAFGPGTGVIGLDNPAGNIVSARALFAGLRVVSGGVKITGSMNFSSVSGIMRIAPVFVNFSRLANFNNANESAPQVAEMNNGWQPSLPQNINDMINLPGYAEYSLASLQENEIAAIFRRYGEEASMFKPVTTTWGCDDQNTALLSKRYGDLNTPSSTGHMYLVVAITGVQTSTGAPAAALTPLCTLNVRVNYEGMPSPYSAVFGFPNTSPGVGAGVFTPAAPSQPLLMAAIDNIATDIPVVRNVDQAGVEELSFLEEVARVWKGAIRIAASVITAVDTVGTLLAAVAI